ncbi:MAG: DUF1318 domain-containing protein [Desulfovibrio sp.]
MKRLFRIQAAVVLLLVTACVTVNIYFPAAEIKKDAESVVKDVYGIEGPSAPKGENPTEGSWLNIFAPKEAFAQDYRSLSNSVTRGIGQQLKQLYPQLRPYLLAGNMGFDNDGFAVLRDKSGLNMQQVGEINRLATQDKQLKTQLYQEKAKAAQTPDKVAQVQAIYADVWKGFAEPGTWIQNGGSWKQK